MFTLVNPPFISLWRPNLGLSLLKAKLAQDGHPCTIYYADHPLAVRMGLPEYTWVHSDEVLTGVELHPGEGQPKYTRVECTYDFLVGEWLFSGFVRASGDWDFSYLDHMARQGVPRQKIAWLRGWLERLPDYLELVARKILSHNPRVVGCSSTFQQNNAGLAILREVKRRRPEVATVMGGANLEGELGQPIVGMPWVDFVVSGEAEGCISRLYELCERHGPAVPVQELPAEVASSERPNADRGKIQDLDALPYPDFDDYFEGLATFPELAEVDPLLTLEGSRGCWWGQVSHCTFCGLNGNGMAYRAKSPQRLLDEILALSRKYDRPNIQMVDNIIAPRHIKELLPELAKQRTGLRFFWEIKANLKAAHFDLLRRAGVVWVQPGIESFSDNVLSLMRKGQRAIQNLLVLKAARENGIRLSWNLLVGHPGETAHDIRQQRALVNSILHLQPPSGCAEVRPDRFSPLFGESTALEPYTAYSYIYELPPAEVKKVAYFFKLGGADQPVTPGYTAALSSLDRKVEYWRECWKNSGERSLFFSTESPATVVDQRLPGKPRLHSLSEMEVRLLQRCHHTAKLSELESDLGIEPEELSPCLRRMADLGLCYSDDARALSLVFNQEPSAMPAMPG